MLQETGIQLRATDAIAAFLDASAFEVDGAGVMMKATPITEGEKRFVFCEPSNEKWDIDQERVLKKALVTSKDHFLTHGNLDMQHLTLYGYKMGIKHPELYEVGIPAEVKIEPKLLVKGLLHRGESEICRQAELFWQALDAGHRFYPSVGGYFPQKRPVGTDGKAEIHSVVWNNIGFAKEPRNHAVPSLTTIPPAEFLKAVTAGYGTDSATLTGGAALRKQSLHGHVHDPIGEHWDDLEYKGCVARFGKAVMVGNGCTHVHGDPTLSKIVGHFQQCEGVEEDKAKGYASRFIHEVRDQITKSRIAA